MDLFHSIKYLLCLYNRNVWLSFMVHLAIDLWVDNADGRTLSAGAVLKWLWTWFCIVFIHLASCIVRDPELILKAYVFMHASRQIISLEVYYLNKYCICICRQTSWGVCVWRGVSDNDLTWLTVVRSLNYSLGHALKTFLLGFNRKVWWETNRNGFGKE